MQFAILFSSLVAATIALPVPQAGVSHPLPNVQYETSRLLMDYSYQQVGSADALSGATGGTESLFPGSANSVLSEGSDPVTELSKSSSGLVERSSGAGVSMFYLVRQTLLTTIAGWYWRCAIRCGGWYKHTDDRRCQQCAQQWW